MIPTESWFEVLRYIYMKVYLDYRKILTGIHQT